MSTHKSPTPLGLIDIEIDDGLVPGRWSRKDEADHDTGWGTALWLQRHRTLARWLTRVPAIRRYVAACVWREALSRPSFREALDAGLADIAAGRVVKWKDEG